MAQDLEFSVLLAEPLTPPTFYADASPWGVGCSLMAVFFFLCPLLAPRAINATDGMLLIAVMETLAIILSIFIYNYRKSEQIATKKHQWMSEQIAEREKQSSDLTQRARNSRNSFYGALKPLPDLLRAADSLMSQAEEEFQERAYAPFWDCVEQAAIKLGTFQSNLKKMEAEAASYSTILTGKIHNFPPLTIQQGSVPDPCRIADRLRLLARKGQKDFEFATICEHRKTQKVILEGFRTLGEAISNLGLTISESFSHATKAIEETSDRHLEEQARLRGAFESAAEEWVEQKRLYGG